VTKEPIAHKWNKYERRQMKTHVVEEKIGVKDNALTQVLGQVELNTNATRT